MQASCKELLKYMLKSHHFAVTPNKMLNLCIDLNLLF